MPNDDFVLVGKPLPRVTKVQTLAGRSVEVSWESGETNIIDLMPIFLGHRSFFPLRSDDALFRTLSVGEYGDFIEWTDGSEVSTVMLQHLATSSLDNAAFRKAMDDMQVSLDGMAAQLGIARRLIADYRKDKPIPKHIALATRYLWERFSKAG